MNLGDLKYRCRIEYPEHTLDPTYGSDVITWVLLAEVWCNYQDLLPNKSEMVESSQVFNVNRIKVTMRYRTDIDSSMRITIRRPNPVTYSIAAGPAESGHRQWIELMCEEF